MYLGLPFIAQLEALIAKATDPLWAIAAHLEALTLTTAAASPTATNGIPTLYRVERLSAGKYAVHGPAGKPNIAKSTPTPEVGAATP